jgi:hypothetical protein
MSGEWRDPTEPENIHDLDIVHSIMLSEGSAEGEEEVDESTWSTNPS